MEIRVANKSNASLENVVVKFPSQTENWGIIESGGISDYRIIREAYAYAYVEVTVNGKKAIIQPTDYLGEKLLGPGKYTYVLTLHKDPEPSSNGYDIIQLTLEQN